MAVFRYKLQSILDIKQKLEEQEKIAFGLAAAKLEEEQEALTRVIYQGVKAGAPPEAYEKDFLSVLEALSGRGADCFLLGCTELPLAFQLLGLPHPALDPTEELAKAAILFCGYPLKYQRTEQA